MDESTIRGLQRQADALLSVIYGATEDLAAIAYDLGEAGAEELAQAANRIVGVIGMALNAELGSGPPTEADGAIHVLLSTDPDEW